MCKDALDSKDYPLLVQSGGLSLRKGKYGTIYYKIK